MNSLNLFIRLRRRAECYDVDFAVRDIDFEHDVPCATVDLDCRELADDSCLCQSVIGVTQIESLLA